MSMLTRLVDRWRTLPTKGRASAPAFGTVGMEYDREPPPEWQALLDTVHTPGQARLVVAWDAGDAWQPINRWMVWQCQAWEHVSDGVQAELTGPSPRTNAVLVQTPVTIHGVTTMRYRLRGGPCALIDRRTWELSRQIYQRTGERVFPRRLWVCQGTHGGHPFQISTEEQALRSLQGVPADVPSAGDLPYAPLDGRVLAALERYDLWRWANQVGGSPVTATVRAHVNRLRAIEADANRARWQQWDEFSQELASGMAHAARQDGLHRLRLTPVGHTAPRVDHDRERDRVLNDFNLEAVA